MVARQRRERLGEIGTGRRGWPGKWALIAALALHLTLCLLLIYWWRPAPEPEQRAVAVALVETESLAAKEPLAMPALPPPRPSSAALPTPEPAPLPPVPASDEKAAAFTAPPAPSPAPRIDDAKPSSPPPAPKPTPSSSKKPRIPAERQKPVVHERGASSGPMPGVAVYDVVVDAGGQIRSVTLAHSSGTTSYDASGEAMIRNGIGFEPPADQGSDLHVFTVTIAFTPEGR